MSDYSERVTEILKAEFSSITVNGLISYCAEKVGKSPDSLGKEDMPSFSKELLQSIFLLSDLEKAERITKKLKNLMT
jgi:hypothetical protein